MEERVVERRLLKRMENLAKEQILYFLKNFEVPSTNNQLEVNQRNIKIKQKIGKFRNETGAKIYAIIRSGINVYSILIKAFKDELIIANLGIKGYVKYYGKLPIIFSDKTLYLL